MIISSHDNTSLPLELRTNPLGLNITNTGTGSIRILDLRINERDDCSTVVGYGLPLRRKVNGAWVSVPADKEVLHKLWAATGDTYLIGPIPEEIKPKGLHVGDVGHWSTSCEVIVRVWVETDRGSATYSFK
jgi:hypothetical protein